MSEQDPLGGRAPTAVPLVPVQDRSGHLRRLFSLEGLTEEQHALLQRGAKSALENTHRD